MAVKCLAGLSTKTLVLIGVAVTTVVVVAVVVPVVVTQNNDDDTTGGSNGDSGNGGGGGSSDSLGYSTTEGVCPGGQPYYVTGLTAAQKQLLVDTHNFYRNKVAKGEAPDQSSATDMLEMVWSDEIAEKAYSWADECLFEHDGYDDRETTNFPSVGQNLAYKGYSSIDSPYDLADMVKMWYDEVEIPGAQIPLDPWTSVDGTGHYTQLAWASSYALGCGFKKYLEGGFYRSQLTCNYGPAGNFIGSKMYTAGTFSAGGCANGASDTYDSLCKSS